MAYEALQSLHSHPVLLILLSHAGPPQALELNKPICLWSLRHCLSYSLSGTFLAVLSCLLPPLGHAST